MLALELLQSLQGLPRDLRPARDPREAVQCVAESSRVAAAAKRASLAAEASML